MPIVVLIQFIFSKLTGFRPIPIVPPLHGMVYVMPRGAETLPADDHSMIERNKPYSLTDLDDRLRRLREREDGNKPAAKWDDDTRGALGAAVRVGVELVAAIGVGVGIAVAVGTGIGVAVGQGVYVGNGVLVGTGVGVAVGHGV